jgi:hypothetical protein
VIWSPQACVTEKAQGGFTGGRSPSGLRAKGETGKRVLVRDKPHAVARVVCLRWFSGSRVASTTLDVCDPAGGQMT